MTRQLASFIDRSSFRGVQISVENESESGEIGLNGSSFASLKFELWTCEERRSKKSTNALSSRHHMRCKCCNLRSRLLQNESEKACTSMWLQEFS